MGLRKVWRPLCSMHPPPKKKNLHMVQRARLGAFMVISSCHEASGGSRKEAYSLPAVASCTSTTVGAVGGLGVCFLRREAFGEFQARTL